MQQRLTLRRPRSWLVLLSAAVGLGLLAAPTASAITSAECDARVNDTPSKLVECIQTADLWDHMKASRRSRMRIRAPMDTVAQLR